MLYLSRYIGASKYGVVDTDDNTENACTIIDLRKAVLDHDLAIVGVYPGTYNGLYWLREDNICVYQPMQTISVLQTKAKVMLGIDIKIYNDIITSLTWSDKITKPVSIRLSDFGTSCASYIFTGIEQMDGKRVRIIMDDKIKFSEDTFKIKFYADAYTDIEKIGVVFDVREMSDQCAEKLYGAFIHAGIIDPDDMILDHPRRKHEMLEEHDFWGDS